MFSGSILVVNNYFKESPKNDVSYDDTIKEQDEKDSNTTTTNITTEEIATQLITVTTTRRRVVRRITTTSQVVPQAVVRTLLKSGDITKEGTEGLVMYYYYDDGTFEVKGTGDGIMESLYYDETKGEFAGIPIITKSSIEVFWEKLGSLYINSEKALKIEIPNAEDEFYFGLFETYMIAEMNTTDKLINYLFQNLPPDTYGTEEEKLKAATDYIITTLDSMFGEGKGLYIYDNLNIDYKLPNKILIDGGVKEIGRGMFGLGVLYGEEVPETLSINNLELESGIETIGVGAFLSTGLISLEIPNTVKMIDNAAFANNKIKNITIPSSVNAIGVYAFANNILDTITISSTLSLIGQDAFRNNPITKIDILVGDQLRFNGRWEEIGFPINLMQD